MSTGTSNRSQISNFYKYPVAERLRVLLERGLLSENDYHDLLAGRQVLNTGEADRLIENVIGVFSLPLGLGLNFLINKRDFLVPMAVEEPSILAAVSSAAKLARSVGGFQTDSDESLLIGQVQVLELSDADAAGEAILRQKDEILNLANSLHPRMVGRGGGARDVEVKTHPHSNGSGKMLVVHLLVDTRDAMGANLVNTMCEGVASLIESISGGKVFLRILSNLTDRSLVRARVVLPTSILAGKGYTGEEVRDGIIFATDFASADPYRAATHNKGVMNGIDAVAIATGNDWRAIEAAAHAYAARSGRYTSLTRWEKDEEGNLVGSMELPLKVGTVGGPVQSNPAVRIAHRLMGITSARELAEVMAAVGLAQNFAALRALSTEGIQRGHMTLHARSCAVAAGVDADSFDSVVNRLVESGEVKVWKAREIAAAMGKVDNKEVEDRPSITIQSPELPMLSESEGGHGKIILLGEHAAVYGSHALAAPIPYAIRAKVMPGEGSGGRVDIARWGVSDQLGGPHEKPRNSLHECLNLILGLLKIRERNLSIEMFTHLPRAMGLGGSAAMAVAATRALARYFGLKLSNKQVNDIAHECEKIAHGTPSGIDNTLATYGHFTLFRKGDPPMMNKIESPMAIPIVIGLTGVESLTVRMVSMVRDAWQNNRLLYDRLFGEINRLTLQAVDAIEAFNLPLLGELMNVGQGLLNALQVSSPELDELIRIARDNGALGAKLTGAGGGGSMIALCPSDDPSVMERIAAGMRQAGYGAITTKIC